MPVSDSLTRRQNAAPSREPPSEQTLAFAEAFVSMPVSESLTCYHCGAVPSPEDLDPLSRGWLVNPYTGRLFCAKSHARKSGEDYWN